MTIRFKPMGWVFGTGLLWMLGAALSVCAQGFSGGEAVERAGTGEINWTNGWITAKGIGTPPANAGPEQAKALAERAGYIVALRNLLEIVKGVRVDSETVMDNYLGKNEVIRIRVNGFIRGAQIVKTDPRPDGSAAVTVKMPLWGAESIVTALMAEKSVRSYELPGESDSEQGHTGLVIDARGLGVNPACFPSILDETGAVLYGPETVDRAAVEKTGLAEYHALPKGADLSSMFGEQAYIVRPVQITAAPREGRRPLKIKGGNHAGSLKANILISHEDAEKIRNDAQLETALKRSKVIIVTDPLIGGIQGHAPDVDRWLAALTPETTQPF